MSLLAESVNSIFEHLAALRRPVARKRGRPLAKNFIEGSLHRLGLEPSRDVVEAYSLSDGTLLSDEDVLEDIWLFPGYYWMPLEHSVMAYESFRDDPRWSKRWFPMFASGGGDFYAVACGGSDDGGVIGFMLGEEEQFVEYRSLSHLFRTIDKCFEEGVFFVGSKGFAANYAAIPQVAQKVDPSFEDHVASA